MGKESSLSQTVIVMKDLGIKMCLMEKARNYSPMGMSILEPISMDKKMDQIVDMSGAAILKSNHLKETSTISFKEEEYSLSMTAAQSKVFLNRSIK